jgi:hypothetical protein
MERQIQPPVGWHAALEDYFAGIGERANSLAWAHKQAESKYAAARAYIEVPCICLGVINGAVSVGSSSLFGDSPYASVGVGAVALITAMLSTINSYYAFGKRQEGHRIASVQYGKLFRELAVVLSLPRSERTDPTTLLTSVRDQYDRLAESAPILPKDIIAAYRAKFYRMRDIHHPEEFNGLTPILVFGRSHTGKETPHEPEALSVAPPLLSVSIEPASPVPVPSRFPETEGPSA